MPRRSKVEELKNLEVSETVDGSANLEMLRVAQHDKVQRGDCHEPIGSRNDAHNTVILNTHYVILNVVKNLKVSETVDGSANLEMLRVAQHDKVQRGDCHEPKGSRNDAHTRKRTQTTSF